MTLSELQAKIPEYKYDIVTYLNKKKFSYKVPLFGEPTIDNTEAEKVIQLFYKELEETRIRQQLEREQERLEQEEAAKKKYAMSQMLITSGFNFDGYRIVKYSGYISGDDAISVDRGVSFLGFGGEGARDDLMKSLAKIRRNALRELKEAAYDLGCNAVIGVDFDYITLDPQTHNIGGGTTLQPYVFGVTANGNAVIIEKE